MVIMDHVSKLKKNLNLTTQWCHHFQRKICLVTTKNIINILGICKNAILNSKTDLI
jgi:hypothetical protein